MKRALKKKSNIYAYLDTVKVLEKGSDRDIASAKKEYWKIYKREWRKGKRKQEKAFVIYLNPKQLQLITKAAREHKRSRTRYIKDAALAYTAGKFLVMDVAIVNEIRELLALNYTALQKQFEQNLLPYEMGIYILKQTAKLEETVMLRLQHPKTSSS